MAFKFNQDANLDLVLTYQKCKFSKKSIIFTGPTKLYCLSEDILRFENDIKKSYISYNQGFFWEFHD